MVPHLPKIRAEAVLEAPPPLTVGAISTGTPMRENFAESRVTDLLFYPESASLNTSVLTPVPVALPAPPEAN